MMVYANRVMPAPAEDKENLAQVDKPADVKILLDCQRMIKSALAAATSRRRWNRCIENFSATTLVSNAAIMIAPVFGFSSPTNSALQIVLASINTLIKGLEMQFQFGSKADNMIAPVVKLEHLLVDCSGFLATPGTIQEATIFLKDVQVAVKDICSHVDIQPPDVSECLINRDITKLVNDATMKVLAPDADEDDMLELRRILGMTLEAGQVEPAHRKAAEACLAGPGMEILSKKQARTSQLAKKMAKLMQNDEAVHDEMEKADPTTRKLCIPRENSRADSDLGDLGDLHVSPSPLQAPHIATNATINAASTTTASIATDVMKSDVLVLS